MNIKHLLSMLPLTYFLIGGSHLSAQNQQQDVFNKPSTIEIEDSMRNDFITSFGQIKQLPVAVEEQEAFLQDHVPVTATTYCMVLNFLAPSHQDDILANSDLIKDAISVSVGENGCNHYEVLSGKKTFIIGYLSNQSVVLLDNDELRKKTSTYTYSVNGNEKEQVVGDTAKNTNSESQGKSSSDRSIVKWCEQHPGALLTLSGGCVMLGIAMYFPALLPTATSYLQTAISLEWFGCLAQALFCS